MISARNETQACGGNGSALCCVPAVRFVVEVELMTDAAGMASVVLDAAGMASVVLVWFMVYGPQFEPESAGFWRPQYIMVVWICNTSGGDAVS